MLSWSTVSATISIHALRVEGDTMEGGRNQQNLNFYPRPPGGGRPLQRRPKRPKSNFYPRPPGGGRQRPPRAVLRTSHAISIHALRVEGDDAHLHRSPDRRVFLSTPSGWRATKPGTPMAARFSNFYPRPPGGGRPVGHRKANKRGKNFYPRPPGGGRPALPRLLSLRDRKSVV